METTISDILDSDKEDDYDNRLYFCLPIATLLLFSFRFLI